MNINEKENIARIFDEKTKQIYTTKINDEQIQKHKELLNTTFLFLKRKTQESKKKEIIEKNNTNNQKFVLKNLLINLKI